VDLCILSFDSAIHKVISVIGKCEDQRHELDYSEPLDRVAPIRHISPLIMHTFTNTFRLVSRMTKWQGRPMGLFFGTNPLRVTPEPQLWRVEVIFQWNQLGVTWEEQEHDGART
jgi:hypothetical protein